MKFGRTMPCDLCNEPAAVQIIIVVFDGPSPADQFLCQAHVPTIQLVAPSRRDTAGS